MVRVRLCTQIDADLHTQLKEKSKAEGVSMADLICNAVRKDLYEMPMKAMPMEVMITEVVTKDLHKNGPIAQAIKSNL